VCTQAKEQSWPARSLVARSYVAWSASAKRWAALLEVKGEVHTPFPPPPGPRGAVVTCLEQEMWAAQRAKPRSLEQRRRVSLTRLQTREGCSEYGIPEVLHRKPTLAHAPLRAGPHGASSSDGKVANRDAKVWHGATETGPWTMDNSQTFAAYV
jgi:hypothetical protein